MDKARIGFIASSEFRRVLKVYSSQRDTSYGEIMLKAISADESLPEEVREAAKQELERVLAKA